MSELVWEPNSNDTDLIAYTNENANFIIEKERLIRKPYYELSYEFAGWIVFLSSADNISILKSKAERIYQIIKE